MTVDIRQSTADPIAVDTGNISVQGRVVSKTIQLALFTSNKNAVWGGRQHLLKSSYPFAMLQLVANRKVFKLEVGDCFKYSYAKHGISNAVFRVLQKEEQELESENIVISAIEDFYFISQVIDEYTAPTDNTIPRPDYNLIPLVNQMAMEVPYAMTNDTDPRILLIASREGQYDLGFDAYMSIDNGGSYFILSSDVGNLTAFGQVADFAYPETYTIDDGETGFIVEFENEADADLVQTTSWANTIAGIENIALLGSEIIFFKTIVPESELKYRITNIIRGRMDTVKADHAIGTNFYILNGNMASFSHDEILVGANRDFKLVPYNIRKRGDISLAIPIDFNIVGRWRTPYIPGNFNANGGNFAARYDDDIVLTWSPRYRGKGAGIGIPNIVISESDREGLFEIEVYGDDIYIETIPAIDAATYTYVGAVADEMLFKLLNYRTENGILYESAQAEVVCRRNYVPSS
ncbi:MAG: hypothetical protein MUP27_09265 [Desulfobacterales bacterium]|nr:hypothetical protein [Desulfobacterales bacterium]